MRENQTESDCRGVDDAVSDSAESDSSDEYSFSHYGSFGGNSITGYLQGF